MAEAIMAQLVSEAGLSDVITVASAGTHCERPGEPPYFRSVQALQAAGVPAPQGRARQLEYDDLNTYDYILAMDRRNLTFMLRHSAGCSADIRLLLQDAYTLGLIGHNEVRDPYPNGDFAATYQTIRIGCMAFLNQLRMTSQL